MFVALVPSLYALLSAINGMIKSPTAKTVIGDILDVLSYTPRGDAPGSVKLPFRRSVPRVKETDATAAAKMLFVMMFIGASMLSACGFGACLLGKLSAAKQTLIEDVTVDLASADYAALLAQLGTTAGVDSVTCAVQAVVAYEQSKRATPDAGVHAQLAENPVLSHGQAWLGVHKKVVCAERHTL